MAYDVFLSAFLKLHNKHCPIKTCRAKDQFNGKPWMTKGLQKACNKKNQLYKKFLQQRTSDSEGKYKHYKNKLTTIMRTQKKEYYSKILKDSKNNIQRTWKVINHIIQNKSNTSELPDYFINKTNNRVDDLKNIVDEFNDYFVDEGTSLARQIIVSDDKKHMFNNLINTNVSSMFLSGIHATDIVEIVGKLKNKRSVDTFH